MPIECPKCQTDNPSDSKFCKECATPLPLEKGQPSFTKTIETPVSEMTRGILFAGRYEIIEELGSGGMGKVYRVEDKKANEEIALKLIRPEVAADKKTIERFRNELTTARKIRHKNVCGMYDLGEHEGTHYITMEYVSGEDLKSLVRRVTFDTGTAIKIAKQVCEGLAEAHRLGVIHRDLKPSNIMIDKEGNARIMDFGIARSHSAKGLTGQGIIIGTPEYMSPEQAEAKEVDQRSDIYSFGVILYEIVTGQQPFSGDTPLAIAMKHKGEAPKEPKAINPHISEDLNRSILKCLEKDKQARYESAEKLMSDLTNIEQAIPTTQQVAVKRKPLTSKEITVTFSAKKLILPAIVVAVIALFGLFLWHPWSKKTATPVSSDSLSVAILYFENNSNDANLDNWRDALSTMLITDLQQSKYVQVPGVERIYGALDKLDLLEAEKYSTDDIKNVASEVGASHVLFGSYVTVGDKFIINASLVDAKNPAVVTPLKIEGIGEESITDSVDYLTRQIKMGLDISQEKISDDFDEKIGQITTNSPEAYKFYLEGRKLFNKFEMQQSIQAMEKAIALDPEFAMAYRSLGAAAGNSGDLKKSNEYMRKAFELSKGDRVSERERLQIQGNYYQFRVGQSEIGDKEGWAEAYRLYHRLVELYPLDGSGHNQLGLLYRLHGDWEESLKHYMINVENQFSFPGSYFGAAYMLRLLGKYDESLAVLGKALNNLSDSVDLRQAMAETFLAQGKYDPAIEEVNKAYVLNPLNQDNFTIRGDILYLKGNFLEAEEEYNRDKRGRKRTENLFITQGKLSKGLEIVEQNISFAKETGNRGLELMMREKLIYLLADIYQNTDSAMQELEQAINLAHELKNWTETTYLLSRKGLAYLVGNSISEAEKTAEELNTLIIESTGKPRFDKRSKREYYHLMGRIELKKKKFDDAVDYFNKALVLEPHGLQQNAEYIQSLAVAYYEEGEFEKAVEEYLRITQLTTGRLWYGDIYAKSFYVLGKINEELGDTAEAIENYEKFLDLWKDADPGLPEVDDARKRLSNIKGKAWP